MSASLIYKVNGKTKRLPCKTVLTLGRDKNSDIVLSDLMVSRNHAMIRRIGDGDYYLIDGGSSNGSFINRKRVSMPRLLKNGDVIVLGKHEFVFEQDVTRNKRADTVSMQETVVHDRPDIKQITILVADIRGFTSLSEQIPIRTLTQMMNRWFTDVSEVIVSQEGIVDKFIGDCVFARWETEDDQAKTVRQALQAAWQISEVTEKLNQSYTELAEQIRIGVGINTGAASMGIGQDNTALGDAVNIAFRLESATKVLGRDIIMSECSYKHLPEAVWKDGVQHIRVKGKRDPLRIFGMDFPEVQAILDQLKS